MSPHTRPTDVNAAINFVYRMLFNDIYQPFYRAKQLCERGLGDRNSVRPSAWLSVTRVVRDETNTADILTPHNSVITLVF